MPAAFPKAADVTLIAVQYTRRLSTSPVKTITKVILSSCVGIPAAAVAFFGWAAFGDHSETGIHRPSVDWLPQTASDISFYRNSNIESILAYEFHISKSDFKALARERGWPVKAPEQRASVIRYTQCLPFGAPHRNEPFAAATSDGLFFEERRPNGGGITVLFDDANSMAYVFKSNR